MSDESTTPDGPPPEDVRPHRSTPDRTGIIDLTATQAVPQAASPDPGTSAGSDVLATRPEPAWFDVFADEHPSEGAGVPARADASWGSDRAEERHRARYHPPAEPAAVSGDAPTSVMSAVSRPEPAAGGGSAAYLGSWSPPTTDPDAPPVLPGASTHGPQSGRGRPRGGLVSLVVGLCLLSGLVGGVGSQLLTDRIHLGGSSLPEPGPGATARPAGSVANIAATALPSVVTIKVSADVGSDTGSGFVIDTRGHVLTNNHVVGNAANGGEIEVVLSNGDSEMATIVGRDVSYDLAVLKMKRTDLTPLTLGASAGVVVGDQVIAVGAPLGLEQSVTTGIVSALNRPVVPGAGNEQSYMNAIQTDAAINPGNSGGPLLDMAGEVIGVNSAIARVPGTTSATGGSIGLGFAIPSDQARRTADQLIATGKAIHPIIGVNLDRTFAGEGAQVITGAGAVTAGGPAAAAGVQAGDLIVGFEGKRMRNADQLIVSIRARAVGDTVTLTVERDGATVDLTMKLGADPKG
ncbi:MAG: trypsin-like peptidase domain-containing protein [Terracoccus sp.]